MLCLHCMIIVHTYTVAALATSVYVVLAGLSVPLCSFQRIRNIVIRRGLKTCLSYPQRKRMSLRGLEGFQHRTFCQIRHQGPASVCSRPVLAHSSDPVSFSSSPSLSCFPASGYVSADTDMSDASRAVQSQSDASSDAPHQLFARVQQQLARLAMAPLSDETRALSQSLLLECYDRSLQPLSNRHDPRAPIESTTLAQLNYIRSECNVLCPRFRGGAYLALQFLNKSAEAKRLVW